MRVLLDALYMRHVRLLLESGNKHTELVVARPYSFGLDLKRDSWQLNSMFEDFLFLENVD